MTLVQDNSVQAINTALLSIKRDISASTATTAGTTAGLEPGKTYNINISGNAETATTAKTARTATNANHAETADKAITDANGNNIVNTYATKTDIEKTTTKTLNLNTVSDAITKYIKLGTFRWYDSFSFKCRLYGDAFEDNVNINILNGDTNVASVCGYYSTNSRRTKAIIVKRGDNWSSDIEIYLQVSQATTLSIDVTIDKDYQDRINISESTTAPSGALEEIVFNSINGMFTNNIDAKNLTGTADKAVGVVDYGDASNIVKIGYHGPGVTADKLLYLAGYTEQDGESSVKLKDVNKAEIIKWLGIPRIKYADYRTGDLTFSSTTDQKGIELSNFGPDVTEDNVLSFMVIWWTGVIITASGDWAKSQGTSSSGLKCALHALQAGTGQCVIRCVYMV